MHSVEHLLYFGEVVWHLIIPSNPIVMMFNMHAVGYGALNGHIGLIPSYITWTGWRAVGKNHKPRHGKMYRNFAPELECLQSERIAAFKEFKADVDQGGYPGAEHSVVIQDDEFDPFMKRSKANGTHRCCWIQNRRLAFSYAICCRSEELRTGGHCRACR